MIISRISAKRGDGKLIMSHTEGEPYFFTLGKSEVSNTFPIIYFLQFVCSWFSSRNNVQYWEFSYVRNLR
jgi:hypothetical protein